MINIKVKKWVTKLTIMGRIISQICNSIILNPVNSSTSNNKTNSSNSNLTKTGQTIKMVKNKKLISKEETKKNKTPIMEAKMEPAHKTLMQMEIKV